MPKVTFTEFTPNQVAKSGAAYKYFYEWNGDSCEVLNGRLDVENIAISTSTGLVDYTLLQDGSVSGGTGVSGTANLDYFTSHYRTIAYGLINKGPGVITSGSLSGVPSAKIVSGGTTPVAQDLSQLDPSLHRAIPGASTQFYLPHRSRVLLTWQIVWTNDSVWFTSNSVIRLFIDGSYSNENLTGAPITGMGGPYPTASRRVRQTMFSGLDGTSGYTNDLVHLRDRYKSRYWCGHFWVDDMARGWHSASLRVIANAEVKQTRIRCRNMKHIYFSYRDS